MRPEGRREPYAGPESGPEPPFPVKLCGPVIKGFGRGSRELGIPTANIPPDGLAAYPSLSSGVYYGWVGLQTSSSPTDVANTNTAAGAGAGAADVAVAVYPAVLSIGFNPFYKNTVRSVEIHLLHSFARDFYGAALNLAVLGFIRPEYDYVSREALVEDIRTDCEVAERSLQRHAYQDFKGDGWLRDFRWVDSSGRDELDKGGEGEGEGENGGSSALL